MFYKMWLNIIFFLHMCYLLDLSCVVWFILMPFSGPSTVAKLGNVVLGISDIAVMWWTCLVMWCWVF